VRLGCGGCLGSLVLLAAIAAVALAAAWVGSGIATPPVQGLAVGTEQDGLRAQQTLFEIVRRSGPGRPPAQRSRREYALTEAEMNAFLARHLGRIAGLALTDLQVGFVGSGLVELRGRLDLRDAADDEHSALLRYLPESWRAAGVVLTVRGPLRLEVEAARGQVKWLRLDVREAYAGRQRIPASAVEYLVGADERLRRWQVPDSVTAVIVEPGRVVLQTDS
jgi:hypothetical protein